MADKPTEFEIHKQLQYHGVDITPPAEAPKKKPAAKKA